MKRMYAITLFVALVVSCLQLSVTPANAELPPGTCVSDTSDGANPGDDICVLQAGASMALDGTTDPDANVLANDTDGTYKPYDVCQIGELDSSYGQVNLYKSSDGSSGFFIYVNQADTASFSFVYTSCNNVNYKVTVNVDPFIAPLTPHANALKTHKGFIRVCNPSGGSTIAFLYGDFSQPQPDGTKFVKSDHCKVIRVHRTSIDWVAYRKSDGASAGSGTVKHIVLPKNNVLPSSKRPAVSTTSIKLWRNHS